MLSIIAPHIIPHPTHTILDYITLDMWRMIAQQSRECRLKVERTIAKAWFEDHGFVWKELKNREMYDPWLVNIYWRELCQKIRECRRQAAAGAA